MSKEQRIETTEIILERIMTVADLLTRRSQEEQLECCDEEKTKLSEETQELQPDVN